MKLRLKNDALHIIMLSCRIAAILCFLLIIISCICYLVTDYDTLVKWYLGLNNNIYHKESWSDTFFTDQVKSSGNYYAWISIAISSLLAYLMFAQIKKKTGIIAATLVIDIQDIPYLLLCLSVAIFMSFRGRAIMQVSNDEAFSAVFCSGAHPFQTISYYMKPNNHILFNLINSLIFHNSADKVASGRNISLVCYCALIIVLYYWLLSIFSKKWLASLVTITMSMQFLVWIFSFEARGYSLLALAEWAAFIGFFYYYLSGLKSWLAASVIAGIFAYWCIPVFIYLHLAILMLALVIQLSERKADITFWSYQAVGLAAVLLLYLPALWFSGTDAITANEYIILTQDSVPFSYRTSSSIAMYVSDCFSWLIPGNKHADYLLMMLPLSLFLFRQNKKAFFIGSFYVIMWSICFVMAYLMKVYPVDRTLIAQISISLFAFLFTFYLFISSLAQRLQRNWIPFVATPLLLILLLQNFIRKCPEQAPWGVCHFPVNEWHAGVAHGVSYIPFGSSVACADEAFFWYYLCSQQSYHATMLATGNEDYYVRSVRDLLPSGFTDHYAPFIKLDDFRIYKKK